MRWAEAGGGVCWEVVSLLLAARLGPQRQLRWTGMEARSRAASPVSWASPTRLTLSTCWHILYIRRHLRGAADAQRCAHTHAHRRAEPINTLPPHKSLSEPWWNRGAAVESPHAKWICKSELTCVCMSLRCKLHLPIIRKKKAALLNKIHIDSQMKTWYHLNKKKKKTRQVLIWQSAKV